MDITAAINYVNGLHLKPNWRVSAHQIQTMATLWGDWANSTFITVEFVYHVPNSNHDLALAGYPEMIDAFESIEVNAATVEDIDELRAMLITKIMTIELHEWREFFREGPLMVAPYHPHRPEGNEAWAATVERMDAMANPLAGSRSV